MFSIYEPQYFITGWLDDSGMSMTSWLDRDLAADSSGTIIPLFTLELAEMFIDDDVIFSVPPITIEVTADLFIDDDVFYIPMSIRALSQPDQFLKNEVRRIR
jgi:hypothetical protein